MRPGELIAERFEIAELAGSGGMGAVYRARDRLTGEQVALKTLFGQQPQDAERFSREAALLAELRHPGLVRYVTHGATGSGVRYLVMEWLDGQDLAAHLAAQGSLPVDEAVAVVQRAAEAVAVAHARGVVHRDLKPSNIFLTREPAGEGFRVRVLDFGVARVGNAAASTRTGIVVGTPGYMAPEQARGEREVDARADVFSLGCVLFECITGRAAFVAEHIMALLAKILIEDPPRVSSLRAGVPAPIDRLVARMLAKDRTERPADAAALVADLGAVHVPGTLRVDRGSQPAPPSSLTKGEQRLLCVVTAGVVREATSVASAATITPEQETEDRERLRSLVSGYGGRLEFLADESLVVTLLGRGGSATDQTAQAAKLALAMRPLLGEVGMSLATGRGIVADRWPVGEVIERAVKLLRVAEKAAADPASPAPGSTARAIRIDEVTAGLLDVRFDVRGDDKGLLLWSERELAEGARTLLGNPTPCVGREVELRTLEAVYAEATTEPLARAVIVAAPAGVGKSRLRYEFLRRLERGAVGADGDPLPRPEVWAARGDPMSAGSPFGLLAQAIRRCAGILEGEPVPVRRQKLKARVARHVAPGDAARVTEFLGELSGVPFPDDDSVQLRAARQDAMLMGDQMRRAWEDFLGAECNAQPVLLILEDLHWGDLPTVRFVDSALRNLQDAPLMVLALARPEVHEQFPKLWAGRAVTQLNLGDLSRKASEKLVRQILGKDIAVEVVTRVVERAAGNAFYLEELIRAVAEGKGDQLPETVLAMVQARLEALDAEARRVLRAASLFGQVFWRKGTMALLGGEDRSGELGAWLDALVDRELVVRHGESKFPGDAELAFRHALVREAAYATLTDADRVVGHRLAGGWLESAGEADPMVLAEHFERGAEPSRAIDWYRRAAEQALEGNDFAAAIARAERGIACGAEGDVRASLLIVMARAHDYNGELAKDEACALAAMELSVPGSRPWAEAVSLATMATGRLDNVARLVELANLVIDVCGHATLHGGLVVAAANLVRRLLLAGRADIAEPLVAIVEERGPELSEAEPPVAVAVARVGAMRARVAGDAGEDLKLNEQVAMAQDRMGDLRNLCGTRANLGNACSELGRYALAEMTLRDARANAERLGLPILAALAAHNLGLVLARRGKLDEARAVEQAAVDAYALAGMRRMEGGSRIYLALIAQGSHDLPTAEREVRRAVEVLQSSAPIRCFALGVLSRILLAQERSSEALETALEAHALLERLGQIDAGETLVRLALAEAEAACGQREAARQHIREAEGRLLARGAKIRDPEWRASFLENVPENAQTLALVAAWSAGA